MISALGLNFKPDEELANRDNPAQLPPKPFVSNRAKEHREKTAESQQT
ncbi:hypothetical protein [Thermosynechococcus sp.]